ncbi:hypothetical protein ADUPG1_010999, partial [Aduncisulcus paluster]
LVLDSDDPSKSLCDISKYQIASIDTDFFGTLYSDSPCNDLSGMQYIIEPFSIDFQCDPITNASALRNLFQLDTVNLSDPKNGDSIQNFNDFQAISRPTSMMVDNHPACYDISVFFRMSSLITLAISGIEQESGICRVEADETYLEFIESVFPLLLYPPDLDNTCPINDEDSYSCSSNANCPYFTRNEVYNSLISSPQKECSAIAKSSATESGDLICYTVHDDNIRSYLIDTYPDIAEPTGMISVASIRSTVSGSLNLSTDVITPYGNVSSLQGLEYATGLTELNLDGYDLSGSDSVSAYDQLVVRILAQAFLDRDENILSGLQSLSVSGCGILDLEDILDFTPSFASTTKTTTFQISHLDFSNNSISDVSVLIGTRRMYDSDTLLSININNNNFCDIEGVVAELKSFFPNLTIVEPYTSQSCMCTDPVSFSDHQQCRELYPDEWIVDCWKGYYWDMSTNSCVLATPAESPFTYDFYYICLLCEKSGSSICVLRENADHVTCECLNGWTGDNCDITCNSYDGLPCNGEGVCGYSYEQQLPYCTCNSQYTGESCEIACPAYDGKICNDASIECVYSTDDNKASCVCDENHFGDTCELSCPSYDGEYCNANGTCELSKDSSEAICVCDDNYYGPSCEASCPVYNDIICYDRGTCSYDEDKDVAECSCDEGYVGDACEFSCPYYQGEVCSDHGTCVYSDEQGAAACSCDEGYVDDLCSTPCPQYDDLVCGDNGTCV